MKCSTVPDGPEVSATGAEVLVVLGRRAKLGCSVTGFPAPTVTWYKDGQGRSIVQIRSREKDYSVKSLFLWKFVTSTISLFPPRAEGRKVSSRGRAERRGQRPDDSLPGGGDGESPRLGGLHLPGYQPGREE